MRRLMRCLKARSKEDRRSDIEDDRSELPAPLSQQQPVIDAIESLNQQVLVIDAIESSSTSNEENRSHASASKNAVRNQMKEYSYKELAEVTGYFSNDNILGEGGFGQVFKATLDGEVVAIKKLKIAKLENKLEESEFLGSVSHPNIVKMIGHCSEGTNRLLVLEFVPNKTLTYHLHEGKNKILDWPTRMKIALQSANGLLYLHEYCNPKIIHRDVKADNILLDDNFEAKVADFSLANFLPNTGDVNHLTSILRGTNVYADTEYGSVQKISEKSDVYSFGVILLELITGRKPSYDVHGKDNIIKWVKDRIAKALEHNDYTSLIDSRLKKEYNMKEMERMIYCAIASVYKRSSSRPKMKKIIEVLGGTLNPKKIMNRKDLQNLQDDVSNNAQLYKIKEYSFKQLAEATNFFSNERLLGEGGFGQLYKGIIEGELVTIRKLKVGELENKLEDIAYFSYVNHPNIVKIIGHCSEGANKLLVFEFVPNNSLTYHLHGASTILDWSKRMNIAIHSAEGLMYLHESCIPKIIHGNIKADNILLDYDFEPKVADISLDNFLLDASDVNHTSNRARETHVYADPEYVNIQKMSEKSDIYSFGVVLLELITGREVLDDYGETVIDWAKDHIGQALDNNNHRGFVDFRLQEYDEEEIIRMICCAAASVYKPARLRPRMTQILEVLQGNMEWRSIWLNNDNTFLED